jgi:hypothetical protein
LPLIFAGKSVLIILLFITCPSYLDQLAGVGLGLSNSGHPTDHKESVKIPGWEREYPGKLMAL